MTSASLKSNKTQQTCLYERDCILLLDPHDDPANEEDIVQKLKQIRFDKWCTGPSSRSNKNRNKSSDQSTVFNKLRKPDVIRNTTTIPNDNRYRVLQRYYSLKARLRNDRSISVYRRERFYTKYPILLRQHFLIQTLLNEAFIGIDVENSCDYSETNADYILFRQESYHELTRNDPHNIVSWCRFAQFYDETVLLNRDSYHTNIKERKSNLLKQISIYDKAVEYNPNSTILLLHKLNVYQLKNIANSDDDILMLWQSIIEKNPHNTKLWESYLHFELTQNKNHILDDRISVIFEDAIRSLNKAKQRAYSSIKFHDGPQSKDLRSHVGSIEKTLLNVFILYCKYEWFCGYKQKCIALLQALIELNIFTPQAKDDRLNIFERNLVYFKLFWESECCRIGENAAIGFDKFVQLLLNEPQSLLPLFNQRQEHVLYDDICGFLFEINDIEVQNQLIVDALDVIGVDADLIGKSSFEGWETPTQDKWSEFTTSKGKTHDASVLEFALNVLESVHIHYQTLPLLASMICITNALRGVSECKTLCKSLLQEDPFNLRLYNVYAQVEVKSGGFKKVYKNALKMLHLVPVREKCYGPMLFFEYLMIEILHRHTKDVAQMIELLIDATQFKFHVLSKNNKWKKGRKAKYERLLKQSDDSFWNSPDLTLLNTGCSVFNSRSPSAYFFVLGFILKLLTAADVKDAIDYVLCQLMNKCKKREETQYEYIGNKFANKAEIEFILYYTLAISGWYKKCVRGTHYLNDDRYIMDLVNFSLSLYPTNAYFLDCVERYTSNQFQIRSRYKSLLMNARLLYSSSLSVVNIDASSKSMVWIKYILFEIRGCASVSCVLSIFNDALLDPNCTNNVAFWRLYLHYLVHQNEKMKDIEPSVYDESQLSRYQKQRLKRQRKICFDERQRSVDRLKNVFELAIQTVSNSKLLYLSGLEVINAYCTQNEINDYLKFIKTKYLNIRYVDNDK